MTKSSQKKGQNCIPFLESTYPEMQRKTSTCQSGLCAPVCGGAPGWAEGHACPHPLSLLVERAAACGPGCPGFLGRAPIFSPLSAPGRQGARGMRTEAGAPCPLGAGSTCAALARCRSHPAHWGV